MRIENVKLISFGPFHNVSYEFAPGMTIIFGPNEAGKTTLHAAIFAALCGMRRGRGAPRQEEKAFAALHRPWDERDWLVSATVQLADGRRIELRHDLDGKAACRATDLDLGREVSHEIIVDGSPDGSRWLNLDRRSFRFTACVDQADILSVLNEPKTLQEHLQKAAATGGRDETAARALAAISDFRSEQVGSPRSGAVKPLRQAMDTLRCAKVACESARADHAAYLDELRGAEDLEARAAEAARTCRLAEAALAMQAADALAKRVDQSDELMRKWAGFEPPQPAAAELAVEVADALSGWRHQGVFVDLTGESSDELQALLDATPAMPAGDLVPDPSVTRARDALEASRLALEAHRRSRPAQPSDAPGAPTDELRELAHELGLELPTADAALLEKQAALQRSLEASARRNPRRVALLLAAAFIAAGGIVTVLTASAAVGVVLIVVAVAMAIVATVRDARRERARILEELRAVEAQLGSAAVVIAEITRRRDAARARIVALGLAADVQAVNEAVDQAAAADRQGTAFNQWTEVEGRLTGNHNDTEEALRLALIARGVSVDGDVAAAWDSYVQACTRRSTTAEEARRRPTLERRLEDRARLEKSAAETEEVRHRAADALRSAAAACGVPTTSDDAIVDALERWKSSHEAAMAKLSEYRRDMGVVETLLNGAAPDVLRRGAVEGQAHAAGLAGEFSNDELTAYLDGGDAEARVDDLRRQKDEASAAANTARGKAQLRGAQLADVPTTEEDVAAATDELARVNALREILDITEQFLGEAEERVHRNIAPVLASCLREWVPRITQGRYEDAVVDPQALTVKVCGSSRVWRQAEHLSQATKEQIYLLLRIAMVEQLTLSTESTPLLLDEVTVQSDRARTDAVLRLLHEISSRHQIILFSQEDHVRAWAEANLQSATDRLLILGTEMVPV